VGTIVFALEILLYIVYLLVGPVFWVLIWALMGSSRRGMCLLGKTVGEMPEPGPWVTVIVPAKDEAGRIRSCLASILAQDYPRFNVLAVDDRSEDGTGRVMDEMAAADSRLRVLHIEELPAGWTGKNHALYRAGKLADGEWLLFIDSDVILEPGALSATLRVAMGRRYDLLSLILRHETRGVWEGAIVPLASTALGAAHFIGISNSDRNGYYFGNGQFMLFDRKKYESIGGHECVRTEFNEDMALVRVMKRAGLRPRIAWGERMGRVRMYDSLGSIMRGWSRIFYGSSSGSPWRSLLVMLVILVGGYSCLGALGWGIYAGVHHVGIWDGRGWVVAAAVHWVLMTVQIGVMYRWMGARSVYAAAFLVTGIFVLVILGWAVWMCFTGHVNWRGTTYSHKIEASASGSHAVSE
jgi:chlorobactene glucosyltransferase